MQLVSAGKVVSLVLPYQSFNNLSLQQLDTISYLLEKTHPELANKIDFNSSVHLKIAENIQVEKISSVYHPLVFRDNFIQWRGKVIPNANLELSIVYGKETQIVLEEFPKNDFAALVSIFHESEESVNPLEIIFLVDVYK